MIAPATQGGAEPVETQSNNVRDKLIAVVAQVLGPTVALPTPFPVERQLSDLGLSSLKMVNLMLSVEVEFNIAIPESEITPENFQSLASIQALVERTIAS
jgi:acyl carrier protein